MTNILVTGAGGFIGNALIHHLQKASANNVIGIFRQNQTELPKAIQQIIIQNLTPETDWHEALHEIDCIIHLAGRAHILQEATTKPLEEFRKTNTETTVQLAQQAAKNNVKRLIFISSIGVNGNKNKQSFSVQSIENPVDDYAKSKYEAEIKLKAIAKKTNLEIVIIRPPLVYGADAPGNFKRLLNLIDKGYYLPLASTKNKRSFVALENLIDLISICISHPRAKNQLFLVSDDSDLSTAEFIRLIAISMEKPVRLFSIPARLLELIVLITRKKKIANSLLSSLTLDITHTKETLGWLPPISMDRAMRLAVAKYLKKNGK